MVIRSYNGTERFNVDREKVKTIFDNVRGQDRTNLLEEEGYEILTAYGFPTPKSILGTTEEECVKSAQEIGFPVVMKIVSPDIIHKSDAGGVKVGLKSNEEVRVSV